MKMDEQLKRIDEAKTLEDAKAIMYDLVAQNNMLMNNLINRNQVNADQAIEIDKLKGRDIE